MKNIVSATWLQEHIDDQNILIFDCRFDLYNPEYGKKAFSSSHLKNAIFLDLDEDLVGIPAIHGGARPFPNINQLKELISKTGISKETMIVAYDDQMNAVARLWLTFKYIRHNTCYVLDGGFKSWMQNDYQVRKEDIDTNIKNKSSNIDITINKKIICDIEYVKQNKDIPDVVLIDSRENIRFNGSQETLYKKAGHIPGAVNFPCSKNFKKNGLLKKKDSLRKLWNWVKPYREIILYCGSGIAASVNFLVLDELGYSPKIYLGGFSDWISYENNLVETGDIL